MYRQRHTYWNLGKDIEQFGNDQLLYKVDSTALLESSFFGLVGDGKSAGKAIRSFDRGSDPCHRNHLPYRVNNDFDHVDAWICG